jgi:hypothetical protein
MKGEPPLASGIVEERGHQRGASPNPIRLITERAEVQNMVAEEHPSTRTRIRDPQGDRGLVSSDSNEQLRGYGCHTRLCRSLG